MKPAPIPQELRDYAAGRPAKWDVFKGVHYLPSEEWDRRRYPDEWGGEAFLAMDRETVEIMDLDHMTKTTGDGGWWICMDVEAAQRMAALILERYGPIKEEP